MPKPLSADDNHCTFMRGADLVIHDCQYTAAEYPQKVGWGHSTLEYVVDMAIHAQVRQVALFHHDPMRSDEEVEVMVEAGRRRVEERAVQQAGLPEGAAPHVLVVTAAREQQGTWLGDCPGDCLAFRGQWLPSDEVDKMGTCGEPQPSSGPVTCTRTPATGRLPVFFGDNAKMHVVVFVTDTSVRECIRQAVQADLRMLPQFATSAGDLQRLLGRKKATLVILGKVLEGMTEGGTTLFKQLKDRFPELSCIIACEDGRKEAGHCEVSDWLQWPFSQHYARTRITAMLLRHESKWVAADRCSNEEQRMQALRELNILDSNPDPRYDAITSLCRSTFKVSYAFVSLVDNTRQWFKSKAGRVACSQTSRDESFCSHAILQDDVFEIPDALADPRFADNPLVTGELHLRFYAGVPLSMRYGHKIGTLCVADEMPKKLTKEETETLKQLGQFVSLLIEMDYGRKRVRPAQPLVSTKYTPGPASPAGSVGPSSPSFLSTIKRAMSMTSSTLSSPRATRSAPASPRATLPPTVDGAACTVNTTVGQANSTVCSIQ
eukprot:jgi/Mesvir1/15994/Mv08300-RA.1